MLGSQNDNTHTIGCKNVILAAELMCRVIRHYQDHGAPRAFKQDLSIGKIYYKKDFTDDVLKVINNFIESGGLNNYLTNQKFVDIIEKLENE